jgi:hypothetical protein
MPPPPSVKTHPAPSTLEGALAHLRRNRDPLMAAWILLATSPPRPPPPPELSLPAPPPLQRHGRWRILPRQPEQPGVLLLETLLFDNRIAV